MSKSLNKVLLALATVFVAQSAMAVVVTETSTLSWSATATKKNDVSLAVYSSTPTLTFDWNVNKGNFNKAVAALNVQVGGKAAATAYSLNTTLRAGSGLNQENATVGGSPARLVVGGVIGGLPMNAGVPVSLIAKTPGFLAGGFTGVDMGSINSPGFIPTGANLATPTGGYYNVNTTIEFGIVKALSTTGTDVLMPAFSTLPEGVYSGSVMVDFVASWTI